MTQAGRPPGIVDSEKALTGVWTLLPVNARFLPFEKQTA